MQNPLDAFTEPGSIPTPAQIAQEAEEKRKFHGTIISIDDIGDYLPEADDPNVLIFGPWLERGGSAFWVSTAGTGKSIASVQLAHAMSAGREFCGLKPHGRLKFWIFQSEDSPRRVAQDRIDVRAELAEKHPDVDWNEVGQNVKIGKIIGAVGVAWLDELDRLLTMAADMGEKPDVLIINPLLAFIGGPISDGAYVTPFLRGGEIAGHKTSGLQALLEKHQIGAIIFHHTTKPPTEKEIDGWMKSQFSEYQGAGSNDITNWGRSFVTMMRVKGHANMVCCTAGKNGAELGWERVGGAYRRYMAYSEETGVSGKGRHAWRDLTPEEYDEVVVKAKADAEKQADTAVSAVVAAIKAAEVAPTASARGIEPLLAGQNHARATVRTAVNIVLAKPETYRLTVKPVLHPLGHWIRHIGLAENLERAVEQARQEVEIFEKRRQENAR